MAATSASNQSIIQLIINDHRLVENDFNLYQSTIDTKEKEQIARRLIKAISQHGAQEEMTVYPWMKERDPSMVKEIDEGIHEHTKVKEDLFKLDALKIEDRKFDATLQRVWADLAPHIKEEESVVLPSLEKMATPQELVELGKKYLSAKSIAPSRPHPAAPTSGGVFTKMANAGTTVLDKARDAVSGRDATVSGH